MGDESVYVMEVASRGWVTVYGSVVKAGVDIVCVVVPSVCEFPGAAELVTCAVR